MAVERYLLLTHWRCQADAQRWLQSSIMTAVANLGELSSTLNVLITHQPNEREGLRADGTQREFGRLAIA
jgi:hypothetical protein